MFRSISRVFFLLICATGTTAAMAVNGKIDIDQPISGLLCMDKGCGLSFVTAVNDYSSCLGNQYTTACYGGDSTYGNVKAYSCVSCPSGYTLTRKVGLADSGSSPCNFSYYECEKEECNLFCPIGSPRWMDVLGKGYQTQTYSILNTDTCKCITHKRYRCKSGYYRTDSSQAETVDIEPTCHICPSTLDAYGTSVAGKNVGVKSCYAIKGDSYSHKVKDNANSKTNTIGKYRLSVDCYYDQQSN